MDTQPTRPMRSNLSRGRRTKRLLVAFAIAIAAASHPVPPAHAEAVAAQMKPEDIDAIRAWLITPTTLITLRAMNEQNEGLTQHEIDALDKQWRDEREQEVQPLIARTFGSPLSSYLIQIQAQSGGLYTELFVMDLKGLNAGQSSVTSDYWQGDEAKWQKTVPVGANAVFIGEPEYHDETGTTRVQVNLSIADPESGEVAGAATIEINLDELRRRRTLRAQN